MRLRQPESQFKTPIKPQPNAKQQCSTYEVRTITPIFGGGVEAGEPDKDMPIRASAIRGQLRYWWRFLASHSKENRIKVEELFKREREIWGGMGEDGDDYSSKIKIHISNVSGLQICPCYEYKEKANETDNYGNPKYHENFLHRIHPYALFLGKGKKPHERNSNEDEPANVILPGLRFDLFVSAIDCTLCEDDWRLVLDSILWWANFGGIGARTRRGLGSVAIENADLLKREDVEKYGCQFGVLSQQNNAIEAWTQSIGKLQSFRQGKDVGRRPGTGKKLGRSYWPEPDSIRLITEMTAKDKHKPINKSGTFPRAAFGLPIIFDFNVNPSVGEPPKTELSPANDQQERMASPLILKAQYLNKNQYLPIALLLPHNHLNDLKVILKYSGNNVDDSLIDKLPKTFSRAGRDIWWPIDENKQHDLKNDIEPIKYRGDDALTAFMKFFCEG